MTDPFEHDDDIDHLAARWYSRSRSGEITAADEQAMQAWLDLDPQHRAAYDSIAMAWSVLGAARDHPRLMAMREALPPGPPRRFTFGATRRAIAAAIVAGVLGVGASAAWIVLQPDGLADQSFRTGIGQKTTVSLPDGTEVTLNTGTTLRTRADADRRLVYLDQGQAFFKVAKDRAHPFVVHAGGRTITALGTAFDVRVSANQFSVTLVEGKVRVEQPVRAARPGSSAPALAAPAIEATELAPGSELSAINSQQWTVVRTDTAKATGWVRDQLIFEREPLSTVVEEMNRYSVRKIVIADASVGGTLVSGNFRPGDVEGFAQAVQAYRYATISAETPQVIELSKPLDK